MLSLYTRAQQEENRSGEPYQSYKIRPFQRHEAGVSDSQNFVVVARLRKLSVPKNFACDNCYLCTEPGCTHQR
jgi:hypothetical protein